MMLIAVQAETCWKLTNTCASQASWTGKRSGSFSKSCGNASDIVTQNKGPFCKRRQCFLSSKQEKTSLVFLSEYFKRKCWFEPSKNSWKVCPSFLSSCVVWHVPARWEWIKDNVGWIKHVKSTLSKRSGEIRSEGSGRVTGAVLNICHLCADFLSWPQGGDRRAWVNQFYAHNWRPTGGCLMRLGLVSLHMCTHYHNLKGNLTLKFPPCFLFLPALRMSASIFHKQEKSVAWNRPTFRHE